MSKWVDATISEVCTRITKGTTPAPGDFVVTGIRYVKVESIGSDGVIDRGRLAYVTESVHMQSLKRSILQVDDILFTIAGTIGRAAIIDGSLLPANTNQAVAIVRPNPDLVMPRFLYYALRDKERVRSAVSRTVQSVQSNLSLAELGGLTIRRPPLPEQQAIVEVLGALDDKIAANTALASNEEAAITLAFAMASRVGATERPLLDELSIEFGEAFGGGHFTAPGIGRPLIRIRDLKTFASQVWTSETRAKEIEVVTGDVLVGMDAEFRATPWLGEPGMLNQRVLRASHAVYGRALVREMLRRPLREVEGEKSATTVIHLNRSDLARKTVSVPNPTSLSAFEAFAEPLYESRIALAAENRTLAATRDALLPQLMSGKLRVRDAEAAASALGV